MRDVSKTLYGVLEGGNSTICKGGRLEFDTLGRRGNHGLWMMHRQPRALSLVVPALLALALFLAPSALGQTGDDPAGVDQYVEELPTGTGDKPSGGENGGGGRLATGVQNEVEAQGGDDAAILTDIATSPAFGAPSERLRESAGVGMGGRAADEPGTAEPDVSLPEAVSSAVGSPEGSALGLIIAVGAVTAVAAFAAFFRSRRRREAS